MTYPLDEWNEPFRLQEPMDLLIRGTSRIPKLGMKIVNAKVMR